jgi:Lon protease-like protein
MFPLGTVLFPHAILPLHVFEPRYRVMTRRCLDGDREFGVVLIERGSEVGGGDVRFDIGTVARIVQAAELPDGRYALAAVGLRRLQVLRWLPEDPYPEAMVQDLEEPRVAASGDDAARDELLSAFGGLLELWHRLDERVTIAAPPASDDAVRDVFEIAAAAPLGPLDAQRVLEAPAPERGVLLRRLLDELADELRARLTFE